LLDVLLARSSHGRRTPTRAEPDTILPWRGRSSISIKDPNGDTVELSVD